MKIIKKTVLFLILNFSALALGGFFTGKGVSSGWYQNLVKAPWTPPGWVFGFAWTLIMVTFAFYMAYLISETKNTKTVILLFGIQWGLNVLWNPFFFLFHWVTLGLIVISGLSILVAYFLFRYQSILKLKTLLIVPYVLWLIIATSLNAYILLMN